MSRIIWRAAVLLLLAWVYGGHGMAQAADHTWAQQTTYVSNSHLDSKRAASDFVPDGDLNKAAWRGAVWTEVVHDAFKPVTFPQSATHIATLWTPGYVYFAFRCKYTALNLYDSKDTSKDFWQLWDRDVVEIFLNPQPEHMRHYYEFEVAPNNLWIDLEINVADGKLRATPSGIPAFSTPPTWTRRITFGPASGAFRWLR